MREISDKTKHDKKYVYKYYLPLTVEFDSQSSGLPQPPTTQQHLPILRSTPLLRRSGLKTGYWCGCKKEEEPYRKPSAEPLP
jgi:hypothetical protein